MANNFLELTHVLGESLDHEHKMAIEIHDWSWSIENRAPYRLQQSDATKQTSVAHITVEKWVDKATTSLTNYCANGKHIDEGIITCRKNAGESQVEFLIITLKHVKVEKVAWGGRGDPILGIPESVELSFLHFAIEYFAQHNATGELAGSNEFHFDLPEHKAQPAQPAKK